MLRVIKTSKHIPLYISTFRLLIPSKALFSFSFAADKYSYSHSSNLITCSGSWYLNHMYSEKAIIFSTNFMRCTLIGLPALSNIGSFVNSSRATSARILNVIGFTTDDATWYTCRPGLWACFAIAASSVFTTISAGIWSEVGSLISFFHFRFKITFDWGVLHH